MSKIIQAMEEAVAIAKGEIPAARITTNGHTYVPLEEYERVRAALERSIIAIDDWLNIYASEHCDAERVKEAEKRVYEYGTLWYIATVQEQNRAALSNQQTAPESK